ncbi:MAG: 16S rRNA (guanine(527)-N(7))-methyltransferase RsmG [Acutalibacteraceae bacterium]|jgi:16S rRNA (guanine(527)-N(7))-methyltransferase RsmG
MLDTARLIRYAGQIGVDLSPKAAADCALYAGRLVEANQTVNLTAITDPEGMLIRHFLDSLAALPDGEIDLIDVGTGAGFPGVVLALARRDIRLTLLDSLQKRLSFLEKLCGELELPVTLIHARAEDAGQGEWRQRFDAATARAVAALPTLCEYCLPLVKVGGRMVALKGPDAPREMADAEKAIALLGGGRPRATDLVLPRDPGYTGETLARRVVSIDKIAPTPAEYPRPSAKIAKRPL